jgi:hypothetical protein
MQRSSHDDLGRGVAFLLSSHAPDMNVMELPGCLLQKAQFLGFSDSPTTLRSSHVSQFCCLGGRAQSSKDQCAIWRFWGCEIELDGKRGRAD